jgi:hypothetical protein
LREAIVLVRVELTPLVQVTSRKLERNLPAMSGAPAPCVYVDKDLVLPPMGTSGPVETLFCGRLHRHGSSQHHDGSHSHQVGALPKLKASGTCE